MRRLFALSLCALGLLPPPAFAAEPQPTPAMKLPEGEDSLEVVGESRRPAGASTGLDPATLRQIRPLTANEALRVLPGVHVVDEEGFGLRLNIGLRGFDPDRGRSVLVMEDGVPISLAPYGEPEMYYAPPIERMARLELYKGADQVLWGPQTVGGALNYVTPDPPERLRITGDLRYGRFDYLHGFASIGDTWNGVGWLLQVFHTRYAGPRALEAVATDVFGKVTLRTGPRSDLMLKLNVYDTDSHATHLGLTEAQYARDPRISLADHDVFPLLRYAASLHHTWRPEPGLRWQNTAYAHMIFKHWYRQDFQRNDPERDGLDPNGRPWSRIYDAAGTLRASIADVPQADLDSGSAVLFQQTQGLRPRDFRVVGLESRLSWDHAIAGDVRGSLTAALRGHYEDVRGGYSVGLDPDARSGTTRDDTFLQGSAVGAMVQQRFTFLRRLHVIPAFRFEALWQTRTQYRTTADGVATDYASGARSDTTFQPGIIPALSLVWDFLPGTSVFAGVHRGWQPPRTTDVVTSAGNALSLGPRDSWNWELGVRTAAASWIQAELTGFFNDFRRQVIVPSESAGIVAANPAKNIEGGKARYAGLELGTTWDPAQMLGARFTLPVTLAWTWVPLAELGEGWEPDYDGKRVPYAPEHIASLRVGFEHPIGLTAAATGRVVGSQLADPENTEDATPDGLRGRLPAYATLDATLAWRFPAAGLEVYVTGKNLTDQVYIAARRPRGIQPAGFAQYFVGVRGSWDP